MKKGATLIEAVVLVAVSVIVLLALVNLYFIFNTIYGYQQAFIATAGSAGRAANALQTVVLQADAVLVSRSFSGTMHSSGTTTLVLSLPSVDEAGELVSGASDYIVFYASSTELYRLVEAHAQSSRISGLTRLSSTLSSLSFTYDSADFAAVTTVTADIETETLFRDELVESDVSEQWYLRNRIPL